MDYEAKTIWNEGRQEGRLEQLFDLVGKNLLSITNAAAQANLTEDLFKIEMLKRVLKLCARHSFLFQKSSRQKPTIDKLHSIENRIQKEEVVFQKVNKGKYYILEE